MPQLIELATWPRREHLALYRSLDFPYFSITLDLDVTDFVAAMKRQGAPMFHSVVYAVCKAANAIPEFGLRLRGDTVVQHDVVHPSFTVPWRGDLFNFCMLSYQPERQAFVADCARAMAETQAADRLILDEAGQDDLIFLSCIPWFSFSSMTHPVDAKGGDSVPRISWGKFVAKDDRLTMALNVHLHHGLADGLHVARFVEQLTAAMAAMASEAD